SGFRIVYIGSNNEPPSPPTQERRSVPERTMRTLSRLLVTLALVAPGAAVAQSKPLQGLDDYVTKSMADWKIPGLALAIVRNDSVILAKGYGVRTLGKPDRVDERT